MRVFIFSVVSFLLLSASINLVAPVTAYAQAAKCDPLPKVEWWSQSHAKVAATVKKSYKGNWTKYIDRWKGYHSRMQKTLAANSVAVVKSRGIKMQGKVLEDHIKAIEARIEVLNCLRDASLKSKSNTTAKKAPSRNSGKEQVAEVSGNNLELEVVSRCEKGEIFFQITNLGNKWPRLGSINLYRAENKALISKRHMKLRNSQQVIFKVNREKVRAAGAVGLWIEPTWAKRPFKFDGIQACG